MSLFASGPLPESGCRRRDFRKDESGHGGGAAAEAGTFDPRVVAVANLDGWLFGRAAFGALDKPYLVILTEYAVFPAPRQLLSPNKRFEAVLTTRDLREEVRLANRHGGFGFRVPESLH